MHADTASNTCYKCGYYMYNRVAGITRHISQQNICSVGGMISYFSMLLFGLFSSTLILQFYIKGVLME